MERIRRTVKGVASLFVGFDVSLDDVVSLLGITSADDSSSAAFVVSVSGWSSLSGLLLGWNWMNGEGSSMSSGLSRMELASWLGRSIMSMMVDETKGLRAHDKVHNNDDETKHRNNA
ncbi:hypothetical protein AAHE18_15G090500 [Arachis hypogaea]